MAYTPNASFNFTDTTYTPDADYVFGVVVEDNVGSFDVTLDDASSNIVADFYVSGTFDVQIDDAVGSFVALRSDYRGNFSVQLDDCVAGVVGNYDANVTRLTIHENISPIEDTTNLPPEKTCFVKEQGTRLDHGVCDQQLDALFLFDCTDMVTQNGTFLDRSVCFSYEDGTFLDDSTCFNYEQGTFIDQARCAAYEEGSYVPYGNCAVMQQMTKVYPYRWKMINQDSNRQIDFLHPVFLEPFPPYDYSIDGNVDFNDTNYIPDGDFDFNFGRPANLYVRHIWGVLTNSYCSPWNEATYTEVKHCSVIEETKQPDHGRTQWVDLPRPDPDPDPPSGTTYTVPIQEVYPVLNTILVTLDDGTTPIQLDALNLSIDADSYTWTFGAELIDPAEISLVKQLPDGTAIKLFITINGYAWHVLVEKILTNRTFGRESVKISGRGLTGLLSKPYEQTTSVSFGVTKNVDQLIDLILPLGWNEGGDLYWLLGDDPVGSPLTWAVDAGAYSYTNKTPIEAIGDLTKDIGVMVVPSRDSQEIYFKSRYPVMPWDFGSVAVDIAIPDAAIIELSEEPVSSFQANGVYIHGGEIGGEFARVRLNGTAGDRLAPTVANSLMTDPDGIQHLGRRILSGQYAQPKIKSITTFMDGVTVPLIDIGDFVGLTVDAVETRGIVNAVSISAKHGEVMQSITIGESTPNTWVAFKEILPKDPVLVGEITSTDTITSLMLLADKVGVVRVRGTGTVGLNYYIQGGAIIDEAPNITQLADIVV